METIRHWFVVTGIFARYFLYKLHLSDPPTRSGNLDSILYVIGHFVGWHRYLRVHHAEYCPTDHPAIYCGNHLKLDDPLYLVRSIFGQTHDEPYVHGMLRNDFFEGSILKTRFFDLDELLDFLGAHGISRDMVSFQQIKIFLAILKKGESFILYPGRRRSCSGMVMDYRDASEKPGGISFFLHAHQARHTDIPVSAVPSSRNFNPVSKHTSVIFGPEQFLKPGATREEQQDFDYHIIEIMGGLVEINVVQILAAVLYLRCLHGMTAPIATGDLQEIVEAIWAKLTHPNLDPEDAADIPQATNRAIAYFAKSNMLTQQAKKVTPNTQKILSTPELTTKYRKENPIKYLTNQLLHLSQVTTLIESKVLGFPP